MSLHATFTATVGTMTIEVDLSVPDGSVLAIVGPNGAGKTTLLRCLAGLHPIADGEIIIDDEAVASTRTGVNQSTAHRRLAMVFQDHLLFPHLDVVDNVAFGLRSSGMDRTAARRAATDLLTSRGLGHLISTATPDLSGGESQRVAVVRALAGDPRLFLLDEPTAALDAVNRREVQRDLRRHLQQFTGSTVLVSHDLTDTIGLATHIAVIENGHLTDGGELPRVLAEPRSAHLADLIGTNLLRRDEEWLAIAPTAVRLESSPPTDPAHEQWAGIVTGLDLLGGYVRVHLDCGHPITVGNSGHLMADIATASSDLPAEGTRLWAVVPKSAIHHYR